MRKATRRRTTLAAAASVAVHLAALMMLLLERPNPPLPIGEAAAQPQVVIQVLLTPRTKPQPLRSTPPSPLRLHRPPQTNLAPEVPTAPIAPGVQATAPTARGPVALHPSPLPESPKDNLRTALRQSGVGCANAATVGLNRREREHCDEVFGKGAKSAAFAGLGLSPDKQRLLAAAGARKEADYAYTRGAGSAPLPNTAPPGDTAEQMSSDLNNDRPHLTKPY